LSPGYANLAGKIARFQKGLQKAVTAQREARRFVRGEVMGVVVAPIEVSAGDAIHIRPSAASRFRALHPV